MQFLRVPDQLVLVRIAISLYPIVGNQPPEADTGNRSRFCFEIIQNRAGRGLALMRRQKKERFNELCEQAEVQDDPVRLADLGDEIDEMLKAEVEILKKHLLKSA